MPFSIDKMNLYKNDNYKEQDKIISFFKVNYKSMSGDCIINKGGQKIFAVKDMHFSVIKKSNLLKNVISNASNLFTFKNNYNNDCSKIGIRSIACRLPNNINTPDEFWNALKQGSITNIRIPASRIPSRNKLLKEKLVEGGNFFTQDVSNFDASFFGISKVEAEAMDPQQRILLECVYECMENSGLKTLSGETGFFIGLMATEYADIVEEAGRRDIISMLGSASSITSGRLNHIFNATGPSITVDTACSSSLTCLDLAIQSISFGRCQKAIVAGINLTLTERGLYQRATGKMLSWDGSCQSFNCKASGYGRSDGCVVLLIEKISSENQYEAIIESINVNHDGKSTALTAPNPNAQANLISKCLKDLSSDKKLLFWECHGTGTALGDPIEYIALKNALSILKETQRKKVYISSAKTNIGHCEAASGLVGVLKAVLQLKNSQIPKLPRFTMLNKEIQKNQANFLIIPINDVKLKENGVCGVSSFGVSGTNACVILSLPPPIQSDDFSCYLNILPISAKSINSLKQNKNNFLKLLQGNNCTEYDISSFCISAALNRIHYNYRSAIIIETINSSLNFKIFDEADNTKKAFVFELDFWPEFNKEILLKVKSYKIIFNQCLNIIEKSVSEIFHNKYSNILRVIDAYCKFKSILSFGIHSKQFLIVQKRRKFSESLQMLLEMSLTKSSKQTFFECANYIYIEETKEICSNLKVNDYYVIGPNNTNFMLNCIKDFEEIIATAYVLGFDLKWETIYNIKKSTFRNFKIRLPNYAFDRSSFWITKKEKTFDHDLIGNIIEKNSEYILFENLISAKRLPFVKCLKYNDKNIFPFGAMLEMIIAAAWSQRNSDLGLSIREINYTMFNVSDNFENWFLTKILIKSNIIELNDALQNQTFCSAKFQLIKEKHEKVLKLPEVLQKLDTEQFSQHIFHNTSIKYNEFANVEIFLDSACNVFKLKVGNNHPKFNTIINPVLIEAFAKLLQNFEKVKKYEDIIMKLKEIQIFGILNNECYVNINDDIIEAFNENGLLIMRIYLKLLSNESLPIVCPKITNKECKEEKVNESDDSLYNTKKYQILHDIKRALEDSISFEKQFDINSFETGFIDLGLDSLSLIGFLNKLNEYFTDIKISSTDLFSYPNINALALFIIEKKSNFNKIENEKPNEIKCFNKLNINEGLNNIENNYCVVKDKEDLTLDIYNIIESYTPKAKYDYKILFLNEVKFSMIYLKPDNKKKFKYFPKDFSDLNMLKNILKQTLRKSVTNISFSFLDENFTVSDVSEVLIAISKILVNCLQLKFKISIENNKNTNILNGFAKGFFKSLAAEKTNKIIYKHEEHIRRVKTLSIKLPNPAPCGAWLITGGTSGIGFQMAQYLAFNYNVTYIALIARNFIKKDNELKLQKMKRFCDIDIFQADISNYEDIKSIFEKLNTKLPNNELEGVIHSAGCLVDSAIEFQTKNTFAQVLKPKCYGLQNLDQLLNAYKYHPRFFLLNSSISSLFGNYGQTNYASANAYCNEWMVSRNNQNLSGTSIYWGNWLETGMAQRAGVNTLLKQTGFLGLSNNEALKYFRFILESNLKKIVVAKIDWQKLYKHRPDLKCIFIQKTANSCTENEHDVEKNNDFDDKSDKSNTKDNIFQINTLQKLKSFLIDKIKKHISYKKNENLIFDEFTGFMELGLDSLKLYLFATDLNNMFSKSLNKDISISIIDLFKYSTVEKLAKHMWKLLNKVTKKSTLSSPPCQQNFVTISNQNFNIIAQHRIEGNIVVPAAFQIRQFENFCIIKNLKIDEICLKNIRFRNKINLKNFGYITVNEKDLSKKLIQLINMEENVEFSSCFISLIDEKRNIITDNLRHEILSINTSVKLNLESSKFYKILEDNGISYGIKLNYLENIYLQNDNVVADISMKNTEDIYSSINWVLYDLAFQALSVVLLEPNSSSYYVPVYIKTFWKCYNFYQDKSSNAISLKVYGKVTNREDNLAKGSLIVQLNGCDIIIIEDVTAIRIQNSSISQRIERRNAILNGEEFFFSKISNNILNSKNTLETSSVLTDNINISATEKDYKTNNTEIIVRGWSKRIEPEVVKEFQKFDAEFFNITPKEAPYVDPQQRWLLEAAIEAMEYAMLTKLPEDTGVFIGVSSCDFTQKAYFELSEVSGYLSTGTNFSVLSGRLAHYFGLTGPVETIDTACSSFSVALAKACDAISLGYCRYALVGAVNVMLNEKTTEVLKKFGVLSPSNRCATFDAEADGYLRSSGVGIIILQGYDQKKDECCLNSTSNLKIRISGWSVGHAGNNAASLAVSSSVAQCRVMKNALLKANLDQVDLIECHGSATALGDPVEVSSILQVCTKQDSIILTASKTKYGHSEAAAGITALLEVLHYITSNCIEPVKNFKTLNPRIASLQGSQKIIIPTQRIKTKINNAMINSFGFSGTNACIVLSCEYINDKNEKKMMLDSSGLLVLAAKSETSLLMMKNEITEFVNNKNQQTKQLIFKHLQHTRPHFLHYRDATIYNFENNSSQKLLKLDNLHQNIVFVIDDVTNSKLCLLDLMENHYGFMISCSNSIAANLSGYDDQLSFYMIEFFIRCKIPLQKIIFLNAQMKKRFEILCQPLTNLFEKNLSKIKETHIRLFDVLNHNNFNVTPSFALNRFFGQLFVSNIPFDFKIFNPLTKKLSEKILNKLPGYYFDRKLYWPFKNRVNVQVQNQNFEASKHTIIYQTKYEPIKEKYLVQKNDEKICVLDFDLSKFPFQNICNYHSHIYKDNECLSTFIINWKSATDELEIIKQFLFISKIILNCNRKKQLKFLIFDKNFDDYTSEISAFFRSAAAEFTNLIYRIIHLEEPVAFYDFKQLDSFIQNQFSILKNSSYSNCLRLKKNGQLLVERLYKINNPPILTSKNFMKVLITGGTGGFGRELIKNVNAKEFILVSRSLIDQIAENVKGILFCIIHFVTLTNLLLNIILNGLKLNHLVIYFCQY